MSKSELRALLASMSAKGELPAPSKSEMASVDQLKLSQNVPSLNFRGKPAYIRVSAKQRCER